MRHWLFYLGVPYPPVDGSTREVYETMLSELELADQLGFYGAFFGEHHSTPNYAIIPNPLIFAAVAAQRTRRLRLGPACIVLPQHNPVRVAEDIAMVDALTRGRLEVSLCRGHHPFEFGRLGVDISRSDEDFHAGVEIVLGYLNGTHPDVTGASYTPRPTQHPYPPMWSSTGSPSSIAAALDHGLQIMVAAGSKGLQGVRNTRGVFEAECSVRGVDPRSQRYGLLVQGAVVRSEAEKRRALESIRLQQIIAVQRMTVRAVDSIVEPTDLEYQLPEPAVLQVNVVGGPDHVRSQLELYEELGVTDLIYQQSRLGLSAEQIKESLGDYAEVIGLGSGLAQASP
jgi:alkanesulfonate monooxygenase SsuD/methylene tetrahydromethanopterin reductase-like flavin-dependent oxidoreductase (luciferase family)